MAKPKRKPRSKPARRRSGSGQRASGGNTIWIFGLAVMAVALLSGAAWVFSFMSGQPQINEATLCPAEGPVSAKIVLLDLTDPLSTTQAARLGQILQKQIDDAPVGTMISIGVVSEDPDNWGARFSLCKPETGERASVIYQNPSLIERSFREDFQAPLSDTISQMMQASPENRSPIMEALQALIADTPDALGMSDKTTLVIVSDMLQHSDALSFYRAEGWDHLEQTGGVGRLAKNLAGARITLIRIPRPDAGPTALSQSDPFWAQYLDRQGARAPFDIIALGDL